LKRLLKKMFRGAAGPLGGALARIGVPADLVTVLGLMLAVAASYGFVEGRRRLSFVALLFSGLCDLVDGAVARAGGKRGTSLGAALDSTLDRYGEGLVMGAVVVRLGATGAPRWLILLGLLAWIGSFLVSYVRARSEGLGIPCEVGILERPERWVLLLILALWGDRGAPWILGAIAVLSHATFLQRLRHIRTESAHRAAPPEI
jgi:CDP-diacylglycerol---glycerol-3-phosphate 3-phosphatidyltransferase